MGRMRYAALLSVVLASAAFAQSAQTTQKALDREGAKLRAWGLDKTLVALAKDQNNKRVPLAQIKTLDEQWSAGKNDELVRRTVTGPCSEYLRKLASGSAAYGETFLMDNQGALVCATQKTTDYWQGDEPKWQRAFNDGKGAVFIDRPRFDDSASGNLAQISVPVMENGRAIGTVTIGVMVNKLQ